MFTVLWERFALNELASLWAQAPSRLRRVITNATNDLDGRLQRDPRNEGESRSGTQRITFSFPLGITFEVDPTNPIVRVLHVWVCRARK